MLQMFLAPPMQAVPMVLVCTTGHVAACDTRRRELFCSVCSDYVYDADFDTAMLVSHVWAHGQITTCYLRAPFVLSLLSNC